MNVQNSQEISQNEEKHWKKGINFDDMKKEIENGQIEYLRKMAALEDKLK